MREKPIYNDWGAKLADALIKRRARLDGAWSYDYGVTLGGMAALNSKTGDARYYRYIYDTMAWFVDESGEIRYYFPEERNLDYINNGKALLYLYEKTGEARWRRAADKLRAQLKTQPRTLEGGFWHKAIYPHQMWLDGLYMAQPYYARYAEMFGEDAFDDIALQFELSYKNTYDAASGLCRHAWDSRRAQFWAEEDTGRAPHCWGRALGWYMAAMVDTLPHFPVNHAGRALIIEILQSLSQALANARDSVTGVWYQIPDQISRPGNYPEASASCLITYALFKGARLGYIDTKFAEIARDAYRGIVTQFVEVMKGEPILTKICQVAGLGGDGARDGSYAYYMSEPIVCDDLKGVGAFIQCACEAE